MKIPNLDNSSWWKLMAQTTGGDDFSTSTCTASESQHDFSLGALRKIMEEMGPSKQRPDMHAVSPKVMSQLRDQHGQRLDMDTPVPDFIGVPVTVVMTREQLVDMARDYAKRGRRLAVVGLPDAWYAEALLAAHDAQNPPEALNT